MEKFNYTGYKKELLRAVGTRMSSFGFRARISHQDYVRKFSGGRHFFHLAFVPHGDDFDAIADVAVRFDQLEDMVNAGRPYLSERVKKDTCSMGVELGNLTSGRQMRWTIQAESDIEPVAEAIVQFYQAHGEPYLQKYTSAENAYAILKRDDREGWLHSPFHDARAISAVGLGKILGDPDLATVIEQKTSALQERGDAGLPQFLDFLRRIDAG